MIPRRILFFVLLAALFAMTHAFAVETALYWYYPSFDIIMHFWGGALIVFSVQALSTLSFFPLKPNFITIALVLVLVMVSWEVFERSAGLYNTETYIFDTAKDLIVGSLGAAVAYLLFTSKKETE